MMVLSAVREQMLFVIRTDLPVRTYEIETIIILAAFLYGHATGHGTVVPCGIAAHPAQRITVRRFGQSFGLRTEPGGEHFG